MSSAALSSRSSFDLDCAPCLFAPDPRLFLLAAMAVAALMVVCLMPSNAMADDDDRKAAYEVEGAIGIGYQTGNAPLGIRWWFSNQFAFDAGFGIVLNGNEPDVEDTTDPDATTTTVDFAIDVGFLIALWKSDQTILYVRPGLNFDRRYAVGNDDVGAPIHSSIETINFNALAGIEMFLTELGFPNLALQGGIGVAFNYVIPAANDLPGAPDNSDWSLGSILTDVSVVETVQLGFHYYFM